MITDSLLQSDLAFYNRAGLAPVQPRLEIGSLISGAYELWANPNLKDTGFYPTLDDKKWALQQVPQVAGLVFSRTMFGFPTLSRAWELITSGPNAWPYGQPVIPDQACFQTGRFTDVQQTNVLFYWAGDTLWWLANYNPDKIRLDWTLISNTRDFGDVSKDPRWVGDFTASGHSQILFYSDGHWWLGNYNTAGGQIDWAMISTTWGPGGTNFGDTSKDPTWIGDFTGSGHSQVLFYHPADGHWWLANYNAGKGQFDWALISSTQNPAGTNFGDTSKDPTWIGDFTGSGHSQVLFYHPADGHWWLANYNAGTRQFDWALLKRACA